MSYDDVSLWVRAQDLIINRVSIVNQCLGARYEGNMDNPLLVRCVGGCYVAYLYGEEYARWRLYDRESTDAAFVRIDALSDGLWLALRSGRLAVV